MQYKITCNLNLENELDTDLEVLLLGINPKKRNSKSENSPLCSKQQ